jgi:hypothetical protein
MAEMAVVFLGGPVDGMEKVLANDPIEIRFPQMPRMPLLEWFQRGRPPTTEELQQALPLTYVAYRKTRRVLNGRRVYSLVISRD